MNVLSKWYAGYRGWEDSYIEMLDALNAGRDPGPSWSATHARRRMIRKTRCMSATEREQMRDFIWRFRGWRGWAALSVPVAIVSMLGLALHLTWPAKFGALEAILLANLLFFSLAMGAVATWFNPGSFKKFRGLALVILPLLALIGAIVGASVASMLNGESPFGFFDRAGKGIVTAGIGLGLGYSILLSLIVGIRNRELKAINDVAAGGAGGALDVAEHGPLGVRDAARVGHGQYALATELDAGLLPRRALARDDLLQLHVRDAVAVDARRALGAR